LQNSADLAEIFGRRCANFNPLWISSDNKVSFWIIRAWQHRIMEACGRSMCRRKSIVFPLKIICGRSHDVMRLRCSELFTIRCTYNGVAVAALGRRYFARNNGEIGEVYLSTTAFDALLVQDAARFILAVLRLQGPGGAQGCSVLSIEA
jgi:hypothetical protein